MEGKKISFSFSKVKKAEKLTLHEEKRDYIDCVEEKSLKIIGIFAALHVRAAYFTGIINGQQIVNWDRRHFTIVCLISVPGNLQNECYLTFKGESVEKRDLVIPMKANTKPLLEKIAKIAEEGEGILKKENRELKDAQDTPPEIQVNDNETLEQRAAREIIEDLKNQNDKVPSKVHNVPLSSEIPLTGEKESTLEDYENIPISDFGMAMLRGMGWAPAVAVGKNEQISKYSQPTLRPKGLGLGADKVVKQQEKTCNGALKDEIKVKKGAYLKITAGPHSGKYGQISGFDEDSGRLIVELSFKGGSINISEFMVQLCSKSEFEKQSRVINSAKYEEYKKGGNLVESEKFEKRNREIDGVHSYESTGRKTSPYPRSNKGNSISYTIQTDSHNSAGSEGEHRIVKAETKLDMLRKYNSSSNLSGSDSSLDSLRNNKRSSSSRRRSQSRPQMVKVERDKKRKGKKKKRDRSRSPNYRKYKK